MNEYSVVRNEEILHVVDADGKTVLSFKSQHEHMANIYADTLNQETAPLHEEIATLQAALEAQSQKIAELSSNYANLYAENIELKKIAEGLAELEDIAADLADNLPGDKTTVNTVPTAGAQKIAELRRKIRGAMDAMIVGEEIEAFEILKQALEIAVNAVTTADAQARSATVALETPTRFKVGDKVRISLLSDEVFGSDYKEGEFDTILNISLDGKIKLLYKDGKESRHSWLDYHLEPYTGDKTTVSAAPDTPKGVSEIEITGEIHYLNIFKNAKGQEMAKFKVDDYEIVAPPKVWMSAQSVILAEWNSIIAGVTCVITKIDWNEYELIRVYVE